MDNHDRYFIIWPLPSNGIVSAILTRRVGGFPIINLVEAVVCLLAVALCAFAAPLRMHVRLIIITVIGGVFAYISIRGIGNQDLFSYILGCQAKGRAFVLVPDTDYKSIEEKPAAKPEEKKRQPIMERWADKLEDMANRQET